MFTTVASCSIVARASRGVLSLQQSVTPACTAFLPAMSFSSQPGAERVLSHSGKSVPADADVVAAKTGEPQTCGCGGPLDVNKDPASSDAVFGHSGHSVPQDADIVAAKEGEPQFEGSGEPLDVSTVTNEDPSACFGTGSL